ncbi:MAG: helix-turn-helix domain-containing protein [Actinomycetota bacterium]|nr:helix-turn-helix domain-containing protein [Actinomycetota bacterium]
MRLKDARKGLGLGRLRASKMCGMRPPDLFRIETGKRTPGIKVAMRTAQGLGLDPREIDEFGPAVAEAEAAGLVVDEER